MSVFFRTMKSTRNLEIEKRIRERTQFHRVGYLTNPYGGMGMDGDSIEVKALKYEEIRYMNDHPEIYDYSRFLK